MKTRESSFGSWKKRLALLEIAIMLCSVFLVALPVTGIAADSEDDFILEIYGNANLDDTIDMRDYTCTARIICWLEEETDLADANYDGRISVADMTQIGLIILGKESELTVMSVAMDKSSAVTINKPVNTIVPAGYSTMFCEVIRALKAKEKVIAVDDALKAEKLFFPELSELPSIGAWMPVDVETILSFNPDLVLIHGYYDEILVETCQDAGIPVLYARYHFHPNLGTLLENVTKLGYVLDRRDEAEEFIDFIQTSTDEIEEKVKDIPEDDKPRVYIESWAYEYGAATINSPVHRPCTLAGGTNIGVDLSGMCSAKLDAEWVIDQNPDVIIKMILPSLEGYGHPNRAGYEFDDISDMNVLRDEIMNRPALAGVNAVKNGQVYVLCCRVALTPAQCIGVPYLAKAFYPDLFSDFDANGIHQQYVTEFQGLDYDLDEHGVFVYHPVYFPEGR